LNQKEEFLDALSKWTSMSIHESQKAMFRLLRGKSLSFPQVGCLFRMKKKGPCQVSEISDIFSISVAAASQLLDKLVQMGMVKRWEDTDDRRIRYHGLDEAGSEFLDKLIGESSCWFDLAAQQIDAAKFGEYTKMLNELVSAASTAGAKDMNQRWCRDKEEKNGRC
jgi:DNA-binding MarR family transcriptional regulator